MKNTFFQLCLLGIPAMLFSGGQKESDYTDPEVLSRLIKDKESGYFLVDVRTPEEYASGHIPKAINIPVTEIGVRPPTEAKTALIIVYCRSGARSESAMKTLQGLGYTKVVNFGSVSRWKGELVTGSG